MSEDVLGEVVALARYPVKSMRAEPLQRAPLGWTGIAGDRQYAFVKQGNTSRFPWLTGRDVSELVLHGAAYEDPDDPRTSALHVTTPGGERFPVQDPALTARLSEAAGEPVSMIQLGRGCFDAMPVSVVSTATLPMLEERFGGTLGLGRFRINVIVRPLDGAARETDWLGATLAFGDEDGPRVNLGWGIPRCAMVTIDPETAERDPAVLRTVAQDFANTVGVYGAVEALGTIAVGDRVRLIERDDRRRNAAGLNPAIRQ